MAKSEKDLFKKISIVGWLWLKGKSNMRQQWSMSRRAGKVSGLCIQTAIPYICPGIALIISAVLASVPVNNPCFCTLTVYRPLDVADPSTKLGLLTIFSHEAYYTITNSSESQFHRQLTIKGLCHTFYSQVYRVALSQLHVITQIYCKAPSS